MTAAIAKNDPGPMMTTNDTVADADKRKDDMAVIEHYRRARARVTTLGRNLGIDFPEHILHHGSMALAALAADDPKAVDAPGVAEGVVVSMLRVGRGDVGPCCTSGFTSTLARRRARWTSLMTRTKSWWGSRRDSPSSRPTWHPHLSSRLHPRAPRRSSTATR